MPKSSSTKSKQTAQTETFDMNVMYKSVDEMATKLVHHCLKNVPTELPEDKEQVNKMYELVRDGYIELARVRELVGTKLSEFSEVMRRLAESRAKANACAEVESEPQESDNVLKEQTEENEHSDEEDKPKKKSKKSKKEVKVETEDEETEPVVEEPKKSKKSKK